MSMRLYQTAHPDALRDSITVATPVLPEKERNEVMVMLILEHLPPLAARCGNHPLDTQVTAYSLLGKELARIDGMVPTSSAQVRYGEIRQGQRLRHGLSIETASAAFDIASWTLLVAFIVGGMAAIVIVFTSIDMERQWDLLADRSRATIVELELELAKANAELQKGKRLHCPRQ